MSRGKIVSLHDCRNGETKYYRSYSFAILTTKIREIQRRGGVIRSQKTKDRTRTIGRRSQRKMPSYRSHYISGGISFIAADNSLRFALPRGVKESLRFMAQIA